MRFTKPILILGLAAPLIAAQAADQPANGTELVSGSSNNNVTTFANATTPAAFGANSTALNTTSNATSPFPPEVAASHAADLVVQNVAWFSVLVAGVCVFAFF
ncbi:hypothetical protein V1509DRAFT_636173 [Lipomyces kononenkoae]